jgi:hypothetical protein
VDEQVLGDWPDVRFQLGLGPPPEHRRPHGLSPIWPSAPRDRPRRPDPVKFKKKLKMQKKARQRNRKRR